ncbi:hypothetical protein [Ancylobacter terrae]|uniref:hypothetical protein n=1 Tax=Ancylobacter sp. sgz301288 TaxID=3342077 RepID=UPI00385D7A9C
MRRVTAVLGLVVLAGATPAMAAGQHDGLWRVKTSAEAGKCATNYDFKLSVKDGKISYAGMWPVKVTGGINPAGLINMNIAHAGKSVSANGLVRGDSASGDWQAKAENCTGSWVASRA